MGHVGQTKTRGGACALPVTGRKFNIMQWHQTSYGAQRLELERELLEIDYPQADIVECSDGSIKIETWLGPTNLFSNEYYVVLECPENYPHSRVRAWLPYEEFPSNTPHRYPVKGDLCIDHDDFSPDDTLSTVLGWVTQWLALYEQFRETGKTW